MLKRAPLLALAALLGLAACGPLPHPFQPDYKADNNPLLAMPDRGGVAIRPVAGLPQPASAALTTALTDAFHKEGVVAMAGAGNAESMVLSGDAKTDSDGYRVTLYLVDHKGVSLGSLVAYMSPKDAGDPKAWRDYAGAMARNMAALFTPDSGAVAAVKPNVLVSDVVGEPPDSNRVLARSLEFALRRGQIDLAEQPDKATHIVQATVTIAPPRGPAGRQVRNVDIRWSVRRADNSEVGEVRQTNDVPAQMVAERWPEIALAAAGAAAEDIADLLKRPPSPAN